jgi:hexosaminidase
MYSIEQITIHSFEQKASWIHPPAGAVVEISDNGTDFRPLESTSETIVDDRKRVEKIRFRFASTNGRYIKVSVKNAGIIPARQAGAGNKAWLFVDEIEVE